MLSLRLMFSVFFGLRRQLFFGVLGSTALNTLKFFTFVGLRGLISLCFPVFSGLKGRMLFL